ncbi:peptide MFS transporter [Entomobacter blattae]|nr:oligopeptide:H+ symporter [Entomobacter blattae]
MPPSSLKETSNLAGQQVSQTQAFSVVLLIEVWERFGYYGMQGVLLLFLVQKMGFGDEKANLLWGAFAALTYSSPVIGGWVGDKVLGSRRCTVWGGCVLAVGYLLLSLPIGVLGHEMFFLYLAMGVISVGNGLFKPNAATLVRAIYMNEYNRLDAAFTLYYMAINVGSTVSLLLTPWLKDRFGWHVAFAACCGGLVVSVANYWIMRSRLSHIGSAADFQKQSFFRQGVVLSAIVGGSLCLAFLLQHPDFSRFFILFAACIVLGIWVWLLGKVPASEKPGLKVMYLLTLEAMSYFIFYQQMVTSLTLFTLRHIRAEFMIGTFPLFSWSAGQFQALNPLWIMILSPALAVLYRYGYKKKESHLSVKFLWGFACVALGFFFWSWMAFTSPSVRLSPWVMVVGYFLFSAGELFISGLGLAVIARYVPVRLNAFMVGSYFVMSGTAMYLGSMVANFASLPTDGPFDPQASLVLYAHLFGWLGGLAVVCFGVFGAFIPLSKKWSRVHQAFREKTVV